MTYSLPKKHFDNIKKSNTFADARRYFTIITDTNLVTNKIVSSYCTNQGTRYLLCKDYHQLIERMTCKNKREMKIIMTTPVTTIMALFLSPTSQLLMRRHQPHTNRANTIQKTFLSIMMMIYPPSTHNLQSWLLKLKQR